MKKILIVDDQPDNVFILEDRLKREGFGTLTAYDGTSCIDKAENNQPDLILLDVMMPGMSGFEVCEKLTGNDKTKMIPIILVTALTDVEDIKKGLSVGAFDYIKKPYNRAELIARVNSALRFSQSNKALLEVEKIKTFAATVVTANHEIKQPLTLINLSTAAITRELNKENMEKAAIQKRVSFIDNATKEIIKVLTKLSEIKRPVITDYVNNLKMIDLDSSEK
ncbi:MAG: response regulator [Melioribacteraceae bacterium]|nr:response regulator [Melioribacteraceae bacterium]